MAEWIFTVTVDDQGNKPDGETIKGALDCVALALEGIGVVRSADLVKVKAEQVKLEGF